MTQWLKRLGLWGWALQIRDSVNAIVSPSFRREERARWRRLAPEHDLHGAND